jgi:hypothetical protein
MEALKEDRSARTRKMWRAALYTLKKLRRWQGWNNQHGIEPSSQQSNGTLGAVFEANDWSIPPSEQGESPVPTDCLELRGA